MSQVITVELDIELVTDVCLSTSNRTLGEPETFTCIPGRTLWGATASRAYRHKMPEAEAFRIFHQGGVRILDAVPMNDGARTYPVPRVWQQPKGETASEIFNFAVESVREAQKGNQCKPLGEGWVLPEGAKARRVEVKTSHSMRTSMDAEGAPRDGLLFGIPSIQAGARFWTAVSGPAADVEAVVKHLTAGDIRVGRSRNAEMGLIRVTRRTAPAKGLAHGTGQASRVSFLCASRCLLRDARTGSPTTIPFPEAFGLDGSWSYDEASSAIRTARIVPFNAKRARPETDRFALERGCVVTFASTTAKVDLAALATALQRGVGEHRGEGYGEVVVMPGWLSSKGVTVHPHEEARRKEVAPPKDDLYRWARERASGRDQAVKVYEQARVAADTLRRFGVPPAQWGRIHKLAREARFRGQGAGLMKELFGETDRPVEAKPYLDVKERPQRVPGGTLGSGKAGLSRQWKKARPALQDLCKPHEGDGTRLALFLEHLAGACMRDTSELEG